MTRGTRVANTHSVQQCPKSVSEFDFDDGGVGLRVLIDLNHGVGDAFLRDDLFHKLGGPHVSRATCHHMAKDCAGRQYHIVEGREGACMDPNGCYLPGRWMGLSFQPGRKLAGWPCVSPRGNWTGQ